MVKTFFEKIIDFIFPTKCLLCKSGEEIICEKCFLTIPKKIKFENNILSIYEFKNDKINKLIWQLKYQHSGDISKKFGKVLAEDLKVYIQNSENIYLIPIPLNVNDKRIHNHAELITNFLKLNLEVNFKKEEHFKKIIILNDLFIKNARNKQAHTKSRKERIENVKGAFSINSKIQIPNPVLTLWEGVEPEKNIFILVDDVTTTGATINQAKKVLGSYLVKNNICNPQIFAITIAY